MILLKKKNYKNQILNILNNNSPKNKDIYIPSTTTNKKTKSQQLEKPFTDNIKRPFSSATTYNNKTKNKKSKLNINETKKNITNKKRPLITKKSKKYFLIKIN